MTAAIGFPTLRLVRRAITVGEGKMALQLSIDGLQPGKWRELTATERRFLAQL
jgi:23S rRNA pseudouridine2457 synthase